MWTRPISPVVDGEYSYAVAFVSRRIDGYPYLKSVTLAEIGLISAQGYEFQVTKNLSYIVLTCHRKYYLYWWDQHFAGPLWSRKPTSSTETWLNHKCSCQSLRWVAVPFILYTNSEDGIRLHPHYNQPTVTLNNLRMKVCNVLSDCLKTHGECTKSF